MRRGLVLGNWKMNGNCQRSVALLHDLVGRLASFDRADVGLCPPFPYIGQVVDLLADTFLAVGAQSVSAELDGAFTGEVSASMLADVGCRYVLVGHSERRALYGESDALVAQKYARVSEAGMLPVLCVGETLDQREEGAALGVVAAQLHAVLSVCGVDSLLHAAIAYEPVWAIGTGKTASAQQAQEVHAHLRSIVAAQSEAVAERVRILYGGSVKGSNAADLFAMADIDGALVGGASLDADEFSIIARAAGALDYAG
jgi:triosephosphate isomerase